jgi:hypothetical protein
MARWRAQRYYCLRSGRGDSVRTYCSRKLKSGRDTGEKFERPPKRISKNGRIRLGAQTLKIVKMKVKDLDADKYVLIERKDVEELINGAEENGVDTSLLKAIYSWMEKNNKLTNKNK